MEWSQSSTRLIRNEDLHVVFLELGGGVLGSVYGIEELEGTLGPDAESAKVTTWGELKDIEAADVGELDTGNVSEGLDDTVVLGVDDEGSSSLLVSASTHLSLSSANLPAVADLDNIGVSLDGLEDSDGLLGLCDALNGIGDDERNLLDLLNSVTTGHDESGESSCGKSGNGSKSLLVQVGLDVPLPPDSGRSEHSSTSAHVSEGGLSRAGGTTTTDTGNTSDSCAKRNAKSVESAFPGQRERTSSGTPGFGRGLVTSLIE